LIYSNVFLRLVKCDLQSSGVICGVIAASTTVQYTVICGLLEARRPQSSGQTFASVLHSAACIL